MRKKLFAAVLTVALVFSFLTVNVGALDLNKYNVDGRGNAGGRRNLEV